MRNGGRLATKDLHAVMNQHLAKELYAAYLYLSMAAYFESENLLGMAGWMRAQSGEEYQHAMKFWEHISDRGGRVRLLAIDEPPSDFKGALDAFEQALAHERQVTAEIDKLYERAEEEHDHAAEVFLQWFITEQVEEEKTAQQMVDTLKMAEDSPAALLMLDREFGSRGTATG
jgi:ferritin